MDEMVELRRQLMQRNGTGALSITAPLPSGLSLRELLQERRELNHDAPPRQPKQGTGPRPPTP